MEDGCRRYDRVAFVGDAANSMGGAAALEGLLRLQDRYGLALFLDDSHSLSIVGERGEGFARSRIGGALDALTIIVHQGRDQACRERRAPPAHRVFLGRQARPETHSPRSASDTSRARPALRTPTVDASSTVPGLTMTRGIVESVTQVFCIDGVPATAISLMARTGSAEGGSWSNWSNWSGYNTSFSIVRASSAVLSTAGCPAGTDAVVRAVNMNGPTWAWTLWFP
ncbi:hypothetical protein ADL15_02235 [Actinoplanes awajinensis subsp. mycoplanecinus]|uniref:Aminotransferase class I/classII domain-containing protein n=1 Tax=Actinoplanes awajinensis subsp. mycoplanecinus TaxID=135947 RepID=A0A0X3VBE3_9ACTN|nr:hypothetical protein ADL15_02235 [Actinoplanes awajinensis subsp. mycoplanecinus]